ncbi:MAG: hypothetical protein IJ678_00170 [Kiritimatiellae bacterium]|nr:hypothetical protein [Kiritimatiellia bacterium]
MAVKASVFAEIKEFRWWKFRSFQDIQNENNRSFQDIRQSQNGASRRGCSLRDLAIFTAQVKIALTSCRRLSCSSPQDRAAAQFLPWREFCARMAEAPHSSAPPS